jgi:hypothetical protein
VTSVLAVLNAVIKTLCFVLAHQLKDDKVGNVPDKDSLFVAMLETWRPGAQ